MNIKWLKTFLVAAKWENFRKASEELFLTQPAVTKHIKQLESHLDSNLFERSGKTVTLTPAGYQFLPVAKEWLSKYEQGMDRFESWKQGYQRKLTIAVAPQIASSFLPSLLRTFIKENSDIEVLIHVSSSFEIGNEIAAGKADLGLSRLQPSQVNLKVEKIHEESVILVGPWGTQNWNEREALSTHRLITYNHPDYWDSLLHEVKNHYPKVRTMTVNQMEVTKKFIAQALGVSYLPVSTVKEEVMNHTLLEILPERVMAPMSATYLLTRIETSEVKSFVAFFKEALLTI
ncbi:LysR family transcriptional regulator [Gracilibacillus phocaeensis]|uniref:LysR family transcriptional regulator n=1 Tax=Gracilibacillus phocaeensis TaxID=2042304 RepID=UPI00102FFC0D|nr:LysR family transcriptional regulator [Gracilibacillus phocaeensis]